MIGLSFRFFFLLRQSCFHLIVSDGFISGIRRKWKRSDSSDSDSISVMTLLMTPIFDWNHPIYSGVHLSPVRRHCPVKTVNDFGSWKPRSVIRQIFTAFSCSLCGNFTAQIHFMHLQCFLLVTVMFLFLILYIRVSCFLCRLC